MNNEMQEVRKRAPDDTVIGKSDKIIKVKIFDAELWHSHAIKVADSEREKKRHKENFQE